MTFKELGGFLSNWFEKNLCILINLSKSNNTGCSPDLSLGDLHIVGGSIFILIIGLMLLSFLSLIPHLISELIKYIGYALSGMIYTLGFIIGILVNIIYRLLELISLNDNKLFKLLNNLSIRIRPIYYAITFTAKRVDTNSNQLTSEEIKNLKFEYRAHNMGIIFEGIVFLLVFWLICYLIIH
ncbi:MAG: hypothetical protein CBC53_001470 [Alphaproteobacteria bacterium TMED93]|nr:hypothetical protein [Pelagibacteraceae bacterium]RPH07473.1 MAG: hypothetical protein CBC53_001470 [Alphaproteobacteria bacterium TMED93]|tara:strand:+ start:1819 stop:2367 length:549 start_codon:yes stop_codon:yes gene_type:complete